MALHNKYASAYIYIDSFRHINAPFTSTRPDSLGIRSLPRYITEQMQLAPLARGTEQYHSAAGRMERSIELVD